MDTSVLNKKVQDRQREQQQQQRKSKNNNHTFFDIKELEIRFNDRRVRNLNIVQIQKDPDTKVNRILIECPSAEDRQNKKTAYSKISAYITNGYVYVINYYNKRYSDVEAIRTVILPTTNCMALVDYLF